MIDVRNRGHELDCPTYTRRQGEGVGMAGRCGCWVADAAVPLLLLLRLLLLLLRCCCSVAAAAAAAAAASWSITPRLLPHQSHTVINRERAIAAANTRRPCGRWLQPTRTRNTATRLCLPSSCCPNSVTHRLTLFTFHPSQRRSHPTSSRLPTLVPPSLTLRVLKPLSAASPRTLPNTLPPRQNPHSTTHHLRIRE